MKVAVGLSGGVDSAVTALMLQHSGYEVTGVTMTLGRADEKESLAETEAVAMRLGIGLKVFDFAAAWRREVCDYVRDTYLAGRTPNPCVKCNESVKFSLLPEAVFGLGFEMFATGHYAILEHEGNEVRLSRGKDRSKDQSYFLYRVRPEILRRTLMPLGTMTKAEVRAIGREAGFAAADRPDSQDFCGGNVKDLLGTPSESPRGKIVDTSGKVLGTHAGYWNYTVGKRKGLGIGGGTPYYVVALDAARNEVIVGTRAEAVRYDLDVEHPVGRIDKSLPVKVRSAGEPKLLKDGIAGIAPGQSAVFYDGDRVVGGGIIV